MPVTHLTTFQISYVGRRHDVQNSVIMQGMRRRTVLLALLAPPLVLFFFWARPEADLTVQVPIFHFYIVTFVSFTAAVVSFMLMVALEPVARPRHLLVAVAFAVMSTFFLVHGSTTPGALIPVSHSAVPAVGWSAWLTLFSGGVLFLLAGLDREGGPPRVWFVRLIVAAVVLVMAYIVVVITVPQVLHAIETRAAPWHRLGLFYATLIVWTAAAFRLWQTWRVTGSRVDGALALTAAWMITASISLHRFPLWNLSWWLYHFLLLAGFLSTAYVLFKEYEQARQFRLIRYYLAASLILTALAGLVTSYLFAGVVQNILGDEMARAALDEVEAFTSGVADAVPAGAAPAEALALYAQRLPDMPLNVAAIYNAAGESIFPAGAPPISSAGAEGLVYFSEAMTGQPKADIREPGESPARYAPAPDASPPGAYVVETYVPLAAAGGGEPLGVLVTTSEAAQLGQQILRARGAGLAIAGFSAAFLLLGLLVVVRRADKIITSRTQELALAYRNLRRAETMRDDLTRMIVHDLRTPLTAISASLGLLRQVSDASSMSDAQTRIVDRTTRAARRLNRMVDDILTVGKMETGELEPEREEVRLGKLLRERLDAFQAQAESEDKVLSLQCEPELVAYLDPALTGRVVENLVGNAFKYTDRGGRIVVSAQEENGYLYLHVQDDGLGVPDNYKQHIFKKFGQVPQEDERLVRKGTGLGLTFCRLVAEVHGGKIWVEDAPGGGSDFSVQLPTNRQDRG